MIVQTLSKKLLVPFGIALIALVLVIPFGVAQAFAGNTEHRNYDSWIDYQSISYTNARDKNNDSSAWDACYSGPNHKVEVFASPENWDPTKVGITVYYFGPGSQGELWNKVNESGYDYALLWFSEPNDSGTISGSWAPDTQ